jgi:electron transfer flavoprotein beta subunit
MNIAVVLKQVPDTEARIIVDRADPTRIAEDDVKFILNPYDEYAVEEALRITESTGGEVIGVCIGPERSEAAIRTAMAMGIHRAVWIKDASALAADSMVHGKLYARAIKTLNVTMVFCGREHIDSQDDAIAGIIGYNLGWPHVSNASKITIGGSKITVLREVEGVLTEFEAILPAVISCQKDLNEPRYPTLIAIKRAKMKELKVISPADLGITIPVSAASVVRMYSPPPREAGRVIKGEPQDVVSEAIRYLAERVKVI